MKLNTLIKSTLLLGAVLISAGESLACRASRDLKHNYFVAYENRSLIAPYGEGPGTTILPQSIDQCRESAGKYLMFSKGVFLPAIISDIADISFDGVLKPDSCRIENPLFSEALKFDQRKSLVEQNHHFLQQCTFIDVAEMNNRPMRYNNNQKNCKISEVAPGIIRMEGDYCFISINPGYQLSVQMGVKPECAQPDKLKELGISLRDIEASMNTYVTGDDTGLSTDVDPIGASRYRFTLQPHSQLLPLSEDLADESPRFPSNYQAEINMGDLKITQVSAQRLSLNLSLSVNNNSLPVCDQGLCASPSNFNIPVTAEVEIHELKDSRKIFVDGWTVGGIAQGGWQGLLRMQQHFIDEHVFKTGKRYEMTVTLIDPYEDFQIYLKQAEQFLIDLRGANGVAGLEAIQPLSPLGQLIGLPAMPGLPSIGTGDINVELNRVLQFFKKLGSDRQWPVFYTDLCDPSHGKCYKASKQKFWNKLTTQFSVTEPDANTGEQKLTNIRVVKTSPDRVIYDRQVTQLPKYTCE